MTKKELLKELQCNTLKDNDNDFIKWLFLKYNIHYTTLHREFLEDIQYNAKIPKGEI